MNLIAEEMNCVAWFYLVDEDKFRRPNSARNANNGVSLRQFVHSLIHSSSTVSLHTYIYYISNALTLFYANNGMGRAYQN